MWVRWLYGTKVGTRDPYFNRDSGFCIFTLPALTWLYHLLLLLTVLTVIVTVVIYALRQSLHFNMDAIRKAPMAASTFPAAALAWPSS